MQNQSYKQLSSQQLESFDTEYVNSERWAWFESGFTKYFSKEENIEILDLGGGTGRFIDRVLESYPSVKTTIVDNSKLLLDKNQPHPRKQLLLGSVLELDYLSRDSKFDIICFNWLLHHLVGNCYQASITNIKTALIQARKYLKVNGKISIYENMYDGLFFDELPSHIIYSLTSSKKLAKFTKKMGANTNGIGVCFLSKTQWIQTFKQVNLQTLMFSDENSWKFDLIKKSLLHLGDIRSGHFWLQPNI